MTSTECRQEVATNLLKLFLGQGLAKDFLDLLFQLELGRTSEAWERVACLRVCGGEGSRRSSCKRQIGPIRRRRVRLEGKVKSKRQRRGSGLGGGSEALY